MMIREAYIEQCKKRAREYLVRGDVPNAITSMLSDMITLGDLWQWQDFEVEPALRRIRLGDTSEKAGSHCRWCVRQTECRAFAGLHQQKASSVFDDEP